MSHIHTYSWIYRHTLTYSNIIRHIQAYSRFIQAYSEPCVTLTYSELWYIQNSQIFKTRGIFRTLVYPKLWLVQNQRHIQNPGLFRTLGYSELEACSEPCQTFTMERFEKQVTAIITFPSCNYFRNISFSCPLVHERNMIFFNTGLVFTSEDFIQCKESIGARVEVLGTVNFDITLRFTVILLITFDFQPFS